jgi:hypothetical protein
MATVHIIEKTSVPPDRVLAAAHDFSERRSEIFPAVQIKHMEVHDLGETSADVTEGTRSGPMYNWERCDYDWSQPGLVRADVTDSNIYDVAPSWWELRATPDGAGSKVDLVWERQFLRTPKGRLLNFAFTRFGDRIFGKYARDVLSNIEALEQP